MSEKEKLLSQINRLKKDNQQLRQLLNQTEQEMNRINEKNEAETKEVKQLLRGIIPLLNKVNEDYGQQMRDRAVQVNYLDENFYIRTVQIHDMEQLVNRLQNLLEGLIHQQVNLENENKDWNFERAQLQQEILLMQEEFDEVQDSNDLIEEEISQIKEEIKQIESYFEDYTPDFWKAIRESVNL